MRREEHELYDADITPGISDEPIFEEEDHAANVGAFADGGTANAAYDAMDMDSGVVCARDNSRITGIGASNLAATTKRP